MKNEQLLNQQIEIIAQWIVESKHIVAFTGAGISTDSGIPDFRGPDGVWTRRDSGLPPPKWRVAPGQIKPNASHLALVELQRLGKLQFVITQNTDNLHRASSIDPPRPAARHAPRATPRRTAPPAPPRTGWPSGTATATSCGAFRATGSTPARRSAGTPGGSARATGRT